LERVYEQIKSFLEQKKMNYVNFSECSFVECKGIKSFQTLPKGVEPVIFHRLSVAPPVSYGNL